MPRSTGIGFHKAAGCSAEAYAPTDGVKFDDDAQPSRPMITDASPTRPPDRLKSKAISYYRSKAATYTERYSVQAGGDLLWLRHNALIDLISAWDLPSGSRFVDLGCGPGVLTRDLAGMGYRGVGIDASAAMIRSCRQMADQIKWEYAIGDVESIPCGDRLFDAAVCAGVIDYLPSDDLLLAEAARLLKPGGRFLLCVTNTFGYTVCLSRLIYYLKKVPGITPLASRLRSAVVGGSHGVMDFDFAPRKHAPSLLRRRLLDHGFVPKADRYTHYTLLPAPLCTISTRLTRTLDSTLDGLNNSWLRGIGSCYIVDCEYKPIA